MHIIKAKIILALLCLVLPLCSFSNTILASKNTQSVQKFWDLPKSHWAFEYVNELATLDIINGYDDGSFKPRNQVLRSEWVKILSCIDENKTLTEDTNTLYAVDYDYNDWFSVYINKTAQYMNFWTVNGKQYFKPHQPITREDVTVSLVKLKGYSTTDVDYSYITAFSDSDSISAPLKKYVAVAVEKKLITGFEDNTFRGQDTLTRAEAATLIWRAIHPKDETTPNDTVIESKNDNKPNQSDNADDQVTKKENATPAILQEPSNEDEAKNNEKSKPDTIDTPLETINNKFVYVDTVIKTNGVSIYNFAQYGDTLYWVDDEFIYYELDIKNLKVKKEKNLKDVIIKHENKEWEILTEGHERGIYSLCYNEDNGAVMINTFIKEKNPLSSFNRTRCVVINLNTLEILPLKNQWYKSDILININEDKSILYGKVNIYKSEYDNNMYNITPSQDTDYLNGIRTNITNYPIIKEDKNSVYYVHEPVASKRGIHRYDFNKSELIIEFPYGDHLAIAFSEFIWILNRKTDMLYKYNYNGAYLSEYYLEDVNIKDKKAFNCENVENIFFVSSDEKIVFYDTATECIRVLF